MVYWRDLGIMSDVGWNKIGVGEERVYSKDEKGV